MSDKFSNRIISVYLSEVVMTWGYWTNVFIKSMDDMDMYMVANAPAMHSLVIGP